METFWPHVLDKLRLEIKENSFENFFSNAEILDVRQKGDLVEIHVTDSYVQAIIEQVYTDKLKNALFSVTGEKLSVIILEGELRADTSASADTATPRTHASQPPPLFNPRYTFDTFVVGESNRFAQAAAESVAKKPSRIFNPLFIYGGSGLGKTHLMHAIGQAVLKNRPNIKVAYVSTETFTNEFIYHIRTGNANTFKNRYRYADVLLIDDIQFLAGKESTQEEFFYTFNTLHEASKQIVISSDRPPREIETLEERLRYRFEGGLITDIQAPDFETRCAILQRKATNDRVSISEEVIFHIAGKLRSNIRQLEGALNKIIYHAKINDIDHVNMEQAKEILRGLLPPDTEEKPRLTINLIQRVVAEHYQISTEDIKSKRKDRFISHPRQVAMFLCRDMLGVTQKQIGASFGGRDHTTFIHAYDKISQGLAENETLQQDVEQIKKALLG
ncbi:MAG: chromosomal replication initiator protein DnaA [Clostridiales bacterium]|nr:chromosomal replication initiator protein DnaA [Clostridiales bacterium]